MSKKLLSVLLAVVLVACVGLAMFSVSAADSTLEVGADKTFTTFQAALAVATEE